MNTRLIFYNKEDVSNFLNSSFRGYPFQVIGEPENYPAIYIGLKPPTAQSINNKMNPASWLTSKDAFINLLITDKQLLRIKQLEYCDYYAVLHNEKNIKSKFYHIANNQTEAIKIIKDIHPKCYSNLSIDEMSPDFYPAIYDGCHYDSTFQLFVSWLWESEIIQECLNDTLDAIYTLENSIQDLYRAICLFK